jgi:hypothetical protein
MTEKEQQLQHELDRALKYLGQSVIRELEMAKDLDAELEGSIRLGKKLRDSEDKLTKAVSSLLVCRKIFSEYAIKQYDKGTGGGHKKAFENQEHSDEISRVLKQIRED